MRTTNISLALLTLSLLAAFHVNAQTEAAAPSNALRVATGKKGKGYSKLFANINAVCGDKVALTEVETEGGLQNLTTLAANQADLGFAQLDTLQDMKDSDEAIAALQAVLPLNMNLLHIVARAEGYSYRTEKSYGGLLGGDKVTLPVDKLSDLKGLPVAVVGSARKLGRELGRRFAMNFQFVDVETDEQALAKLKAGEVAGLFSTSGWPSGPVQKLKRDSGLHMVQFDLAVQPPYQMVKKNYENLDVFNHNFLAAPNLLVTRPFSAGGVNGRAVATLQSCIQKNLVNLQEGQFEPAWRDVKNTGDTFGWPRFAGGKR
ncbi:MAG: hypothetical protein HXX19_08000 [Rhodoferax sp.]|nr:hypothetical protein [Rhodoferax sp.]